MPPACRWIEINGNAYLHWNYACCATVRRVRDAYEVQIEWGAHETVPDLASGVRVVEHWVDTHDGPPRLGRVVRR